jgi:hypothetical protein
MVAGTQEGNDFDIMQFLGLASHDPVNQNLSSLLGNVMQQGENGVAMLPRVQGMDQDIVNQQNSVRQALFDSSFLYDFGHG